MIRLNGRFQKPIALLLLLSTLFWTACSAVPFDGEQMEAADAPLSRQTDNGQEIITRPGRDDEAQAQTADIDEPEGGDLTDLVAAIEEGDYGNVDSLLVWKDGALHVDAHFRGQQASELHPVFSVTKSITSAAIGIALEEGHIPSVETPLADLLPNYEELQTVDKLAITLEDVLTMRTGFEWDESSVTYGQPGNDASDMFRSSDWLAFVVERQLVANPGESFLYNSGNTVLLSGVLEEGTAVSVEDYVAEKIFTPLGITNWRWEKTRGGLSNTGWGLHLAPEDMLKIGILFLNGGAWEDEQIIPAEWVQTSTATHLEAGETTDYGYQWWRFREDSHWLEALPSKNVFFAWGFGGNFIWVAPEENAVIVSTGENFAESTQIFEALETAVFPWLATQ